VPAPKSREARGYGREHRAEKARLNPIVEQHGALCHAKRCLMSSRVIPPGTRSDEWDLGHTIDRTRWTGPEHPLCNRSEGATRGNKARKRPSKSRPAWVM
jgi:hypothetical protein